MERRMIEALQQERLHAAERLRTDARHGPGAAATVGTLLVRAGDRLERVGRRLAPEACPVTPR
jgi:hypothetical protein